VKPNSSPHHNPPAAALTRRPADPIRVGAGTAFFLEGELETGGIPVDRVSLRVGAVERPVDAHSIPAARSYGAGSAWWSLVVVEESEPIGDVAVTLVVATGGETLEIELGTIRLGTRYEGLPEPCELPAAIDPDGAGAGAEPLIAICMTTFEPPPERLARQLDSIRAQTWPNWVCVISDDHSAPAAYAELERQTAGDPRFLLSRSPERLGFLRNFERAIRLAPEPANLISLADQDDRWDDDKLEVLAGALLADPGSNLAYSDVRIADQSGAILSDTYWFERRNSTDSMASMMIANNVTGAASMFRRELLGAALPFPPGGTGQELYHDHWLALCALASGPLTYVDRPTHDYTRHDASVTVLETEGHWVVPPQDRREALLMRWRRLTRRFRLLARGPGWRSVYLGRYLLIRQLATMLELRVGRDAIPRRHRRDLARLLAAERSPRAAGWLLARSFRPWVGRNETLARERVIFGGILWRRLVGRWEPPSLPQRNKRRALPGPALVRAIVWRRLAAIRRFFQPPTQPPPPISAPARDAAAGGAAAPGGRARRNGTSLTPILVDYFGRDGSTAMLKLLASTHDVVVEGSYPFELQQLAQVLRSNDPEASWSTYCRRFTTDLDGPPPRFYAEKMLDVRDLGGAKLPELRTIVLLRDPRDTYVSIESFSRAVGAAEIGGAGASEERLDRFVERQRLRLDWIAGLRRDQTTTLIVYEQLAADLPAVAATISAWLGVELDPAAVAEDFRLRWIHGTSPDPRRSVGRWRGELDDAVVERLRRDLGERMSELGYADWDI
jgi:glycosyltransferase involved in cell wall biosynthesis